MMTIPQRSAAAAACLALALGLASPAAAQDWPTRPVTMVVPYAAGGPADIVGRMVVPRMSEILGQQVIVENIGGAGGITGAVRVAHATPDGYQFLMGPAGLMSQNESLYKHLPYDSVKDFTAIGMIATAPPVLIARIRGLLRRREWLAAAIPAVIAYNLLGSSIREFAARGDDFALEMLNAVERSAAQVHYAADAAGVRR